MGIRDPAQVSQLLLAGIVAQNAAQNSSARVNHGEAMVRPTRPKQVSVAATAW